MTAPAFVVRVRKRPVVVEAAHFMAPAQGQRIADWCGGTWIPSVEEIAIATLEGTMRAALGDWIICGTAGEFYPVKPAIFTETYDMWEGVGEEVRP